MIVFDLKCRKDHVFEGWFADSTTFEAQTGAREISCPICGDTNVVKALMAPNVVTRTSAAKAADTEAKPDKPLTLAQQKEQAGQMLAMVRAVKEHVEKNFDNVGTRFAQEARKIHYGEADKRSIYGKATKDEARELKDEGIEFGELPDLPSYDG